VCAGVPRAKGGASASCVAAYRLTQGGAEPAGLLLPSGVKMLSFVRSLPAVDAFLTGGGALGQDLALNTRSIL
jgi:hypothetical protein